MSAKSFLIFTLALFLTICLPAVLSVKWINCPGATLKGKVTKVDVAGCETTPVCSLTKGKNASIEIDFVPDEATKEAKSVVHGIIASIPIPFHLDNDDVCKDSGVTCPLAKGTTYQYKTAIFVKSEYPSVSVKVKWEIRDDDGNDIICIELPARLSSSDHAQNRLRTDTRLLFQSRVL